MTIQEILEAHRFAPMALPGERQCIGCDWEPTIWHNGTEEHRAHVAELIDQHKMLAVIARAIGELRR